MTHLFLTGAARCYDQDAALIRRDGTQPVLWHPTPRAPQASDSVRPPAKPASIHSLKAAEPSQFPAHARLRPTPPNATEQPALHIVIADDNPSDRELLRQYLLRDPTSRFVFREAATGIQAIEASLSSPPPDCVLLDLRLPDMSGLQYIDRMRGNKDLLPFPVIVLTGLEHTAQQGKAALMLGAQDYLGKSFITPESLSRAVANAMERFRLTQQVKRSELYFRTLFEAAGVANAETDAASGRFLRVNKRYCDLVGYSAAELLQTTFLQLTHPEDRARNLAERQQAVEEKRSNFDVEKRYVRKDGAVIWVHVSTTLMRDERGAIQSFLGSIFDITETKRAQETMAQSSEQLRLFAEHAPAAIAMLDKDMRYITTSQRWLADFGLTGRDVRGRSHYEVLPDQPQRWKEVHRRCLAGAVERAEEDFFEDAAGPHWLRWEIHPWRDAGGAVAGIIVFSEDISARKRAEQVRTEADMNKDAFIATLAHELRNPLAPVANAARVMKDVTLNDPTLVWCREVIERQVVQMGRLLDDMRDVAHITRKNLELRVEPVELSAVLAHATEMAGPLVDAAGHRLTLSIPEHPVLLNGDRARLAQIFTNLLINAAKYTPASGHIELSAEVHGAEVRVTVSDNGIGLAAPDLRKVFNMFAQVESALERSQGGLGIGLALVKGLVDLHGGSISVSSEGPGKGCRFAVCLPVGAQHPVPRSIEPHRPPAPIPPRRVMVVDDNPDNADSLAILLELAGHEIAKACDGRQAIGKAEEFRPEVILLDIGLPHMNGYDTCRAIRNESWGKEITIVAVTGWGQEEDFRRTREAGFDAHLTKPIDHARLMALLRP